MGAAFICLKLGLLHTKAAMLQILRGYKDNNKSYKLGWSAEVLCWRLKDSFSQNNTFPAPLPSYFLTTTFLIVFSVAPSYDCFGCPRNLLHLLKELRTFLSSLYFPTLIKFREIPNGQFFIEFRNGKYELHDKDGQTVSFSFALLFTWTQYFSAWKTQSKKMSCSNWCEGNGSISAVTS